MAFFVCLLKIFQECLVTSLSFCLLTCERGGKGLFVQVPQGRIGLPSYSNSVLLPFLERRGWRLQSPNPNPVTLWYGLCGLGQVTAGL